MPKSLFALLPFALTAQVSVAGTAAPMRFQCDTYMARDGEHTRRLLTLDLDHATVEDGPMRFHNGDPVVVHGSPLPLANPSVSFIRRAGEHVEWGSRKSETAEIINHFSLDLETGAYMFSGSGMTLSRGRCRALPDSI